AASELLTALAATALAALPGSQPQHPLVQAWLSSMRHLGPYLQALTAALHTSLPSLQPHLDEAAAGSMAGCVAAYMLPAFT
ncbi:hypothetical protein HaLaN_33179, partial [Haematococcus lacustris]